MFQLQWCSALGWGYSWQLWVRSEAVSALQDVVPSPAGGCFGGRGTFSGGWAVPSHTWVPMAAACGPPQPSSAHSYRGRL